MQLRAPLLSILIFVLAGPAIGLVTAYAAEPLLRWAEFRALSLIGLAYLVGALPALVAGVLYVLLWQVPLRLPIANARIQGGILGLISAVPVLVLVLARSMHAWTIANCLAHLVPAAACGMLAANIRDTRIRD